MVQKSDILTAKQAIEGALWKFVNQSASAKVHVFETEWGHLRALVGSGAFKAMRIVDRLDLIWKYLREHVNQEDLVHLSRVDPMDLAEYDAHVAEV